MKVTYFTGIEKRVIAPTSLPNKNSTAEQLKLHGFVAARNHISQYKGRYQRIADYASTLEGVVIIACPLIKEVDQLAMLLDANIITGNTLSADRKRIFENMVSGSNKITCITYPLLQGLGVRLNVDHFIHTSYTKYGMQIAAPLYTMKVGTFHQIVDNCSMNVVIPSYIKSLYDAGLSIEETNKPQVFQKRNSEYED